MKSEAVAKRTWKKGFVHLTVDGFGLVSLWDDKKTGDSYLRLPLTKRQQKMIRDTMKKGGATP